MYQYNFSIYILFFVVFCVDENNLITSSPIFLDDLIEQIKNDNNNNGLNGKSTKQKKKKQKEEDLLFHLKKY